MEFDLENPLPSFEDQQQSETIQDLFASESAHMSTLKTSDFHVSFRRQLISLILQAQFSSNLDPLISYLALNYMDRFISTQEFLSVYDGRNQEKPWLMRLIAISCLSLAAKMKTTPLSPSDFQRDEGLIFDAQSINKMELMILDALNWRLRSITPFSFVQFLISLLGLKDPQLIQALKDGASEIIFKTHQEIKFLEFKPSIIAASALLSVSGDRFPSQFPSFKCSIVSCGYINQESVVQCFDAMRDVEGYYESVLETVSSTKTPMSVLESCETATTSMSGSKRRKMSGLWRGTRFHTS